MRTTRTPRGGMKISGRSLYSLQTNDVIQIRYLSITLEITFFRTCSNVLQQLNRIFTRFSECLIQYGLQLILFHCYQSINKGHWVHCGSCGKCCSLSIWVSLAKNRGFSRWVSTKTTIMKRRYRQRKFHFKKKNPTYISVNTYLSLVSPLFIFFLSFST